MIVPTYPLLIDNYGNSKGGRPVTDRIGTITTSDHHGLVTHESLAAYIQYYYNGTQTSHITDVLATVTTTDRASLIQPSVDIEDCHYRMLRPHEIQAAMAFPKDYKVLGNSREQVKQLGNAVTPPSMEWLIGRVIDSLN